MNILILGSGGREHAAGLENCRQSVDHQLYCAPGNAGIAQEAECVALDIADHAAVIAFCKANKIDFVVVGPEVPLVAGIVDDLKAAGIEPSDRPKWAARLGRLQGLHQGSVARGATIFRPPPAERFKRAEPAKDDVRSSRPRRSC